MLLKITPAINYNRSSSLFHNMKGIFKVTSPQVVPSLTLPLNKVHISGELVHGAAVAVYMGGVAMGAAKLFTFQRERTTRCCLM